MTPFEEYFQTDSYFVQNAFPGITETLEDCVKFIKANLKHEFWSSYEIPGKGFVVVEDRFGFGPMNLFLFFVKPEYRKTEIKNELVQHAIKLSNGRGLIAAVPEVNEKITHFYKKHGKHVNDLKINNNNYSVFTFGE